ncbi:l-Fucosyltransferase [Trichonephila clavata]|uniref:L-Fucosyltransferase n=1 Tax=Trichonephila clavata TaxID=2740835 RepID=A0A8X6KVB4_TRICU|nr:l-Fucosyltransferase [Trichonephila clavata]
MNVSHEERKTRSFASASVMLKLKRILMLSFYYIRHWKLFPVLKRSSNQRKSAVIVICILFSALTAVYYFSNVGDIIFYYLYSDSKALPLSIQCNKGRLGNQLCTYATLYGLGHLNDQRSTVALGCNINKLKAEFKHLSIPRAPFLYFRWNPWSILSYLRPVDATIPPNSNFING